MSDAKYIAAAQQGARQSFPLFTAMMKGKDFFTPFHLVYYKILNAFAHKRIKRLIVSIPPQHGKSEGSTRLLPAYLFGLNPDLKIAIASYSDRFARKFNREIQRIIDSERYYTLFPDTQLAGSPVADDSSRWARTAGEFEIIGCEGKLTAVGRSGGLTGQTVDVLILDDLYKNAAEANSPLIRDAVWEWYTSVAETRLHNDSQELIVFTRWHEDDLIGRIEASEKVVNLTSLRQLSGCDPDAWLKVDFEAIKEGPRTDLDPRELGQPLWPERHSLQSLVRRRALDPVGFDSLYQGRPATKEGLLYGSEFQTYDELPPANEIIKKANYTDTADLGDDYLCSICYVVSRDGFAYVTDVLFTQEPMEVTEPITAQMLLRNDTRIAYVESNNGGRGFARAVGRLAPAVRVEWFHQSGNKESRILTNSASVINRIKFPSEWGKIWPSFYVMVTAYKRLFRANRFDDAADALTGIVEREFHRGPVRKTRVSVGSLPR
nr:MAG TPA: Terminase large subunit [Caudoviricetes sp.]